MKLPSVVLTIVIALVAGGGAFAQSLDLGKVPPAPATANFPPDFPPPDLRPLLDAQWGFPIGGWGGLCPAPGGSKVSCLSGSPAQLCSNGLPPVIFVHGNTRDASDWADQSQSCGSELASGGGVHAKFVAAGYCDAQLWALSYNGAAVDLCTSGAPIEPHAANEINVADVYRFLNAVLEYTGSSSADIVAHSLGVTIVRRMFYEYPTIRTKVRRFVAIDGANHGTSICRAEENLYYGCDEIAPGSYWLNQINGCGAQVPATPPELAEAQLCQGPDETLGVNTLVVHNDDGMGEDFFYLPPDQQSPLLAGAAQQNFPGLTHDQLRFSDQTVAAYLAFLMRRP